MNRNELIHKFLNYINLESEVDNFDTIDATIKKELVFKGTNLWILVFAIIVASVGLNMNSTAVIIGAMLISPLMGPINGMGYSIATYNFPLFRQSVKNFSFAVIASLVASTAYFTISPISTAHSELLARTSPTIYDVLIAMFGGLAGIVAISSKNKGNVIPGVAIATALMPPLCTAGYGLATSQFNYFFGALYLFTINTVFIGIATVIISQILKFPIRTLVDNAQKKRVNRWISVIISLVLIPSIYFGYNLVMKERFVENATKYVRNISIFEGNYLLKNEIIPEENIIRLIYGGTTLSELQKSRIIEKAGDFNLNKAKIEFQQGFSFDDANKRISEVESLNAELNRLKAVITEKTMVIDSIHKRNLTGKQILSEIKALYPQISNCSYSQSFAFNDSISKPEITEIVIFKTKGENIDADNRLKIRNWVNKRQHSKNVKVYFED